MLDDYKDLLVLVIAGRLGVIRTCCTTKFVYIFASEIHYKVETKDIVLGVSNDLSLGTITLLHCSTSFRPLFFNWSEDGNNEIHAMGLATMIFLLPVGMLLKYLQYCLIRNMPCTCSCHTGS